MDYFKEKIRGERDIELLKNQNEKPGHASYNSIVEMTPAGSAGVTRRELDAAENIEYAAMIRALEQEMNMVEAGLQDIITSNDLL